MKCKLIKFVLVISCIAVTACGKEKSAEYYMQHMDEIKSDATLCINEIKKGKSIENDKTCMSIVTLERQRCDNNRRIGGAFANEYDCNDIALMLVFAAKGY